MSTQDGQWHLRYAPMQDLTVRDLWTRAAWRSPWTKTLYVAKSHDACTRQCQRLNKREREKRHG